MAGMGWLFWADVMADMGWAGAKGNIVSWNFTSRLEKILFVDKLNNLYAFCPSG